MSIIATITLPVTEFPLGSAFDLEEDATLTVETTVPTSESVIPYVWAPADITDPLVDSLEDESVVASVSIVDETDEHVLLKVRWTERVNGVLEAIREQDAVVTSAVGTHTRWTFRLRFPSYEDVSTFYSDCIDQNVSIELVQLHEATDPTSADWYGMTVAQRNLLIAAYEAGYFDVPRRTTLVELGDRFDISDSAVSQRLRRGLATLLNSTPIVDSGADAADLPAGGRDESRETESRLDH